MANRKKFLDKKSTRKKFRTKGSKVSKLAQDARWEIIEKRKSEMEDARDRLCQIAKKSDARDKLKRLQLLRDGKFDVKSTAKGNFTITRKTNGTLELTSNKKVTKKEAKARKEIFQNKPSGARVKYLNLADKKGFGRKTNAQKRRGFSNPQNRNRIEDSRARSFVECRDYCGIGLSDHLSSYYNLQKYPHSLAHLHFRSNSCLDPFHCHNIHYPVMHAMEGRCRDCFILRERERDHYHHGYTETIPSAIEKPNWGERLCDVLLSKEDCYRRNAYDSGYRQDYVETSNLARVQSEIVRPQTGGSKTNVRSYEKGTILLVSNLHHTVTEKDVRELFGEVGQLRRVSMLASGVAEIIYVSREFAQQAFDMYHNRLLDGKPMKMQISEFHDWEKYENFDIGNFRHETLPDCSTSRLGVSNETYPYLRTRTPIPDIQMVHQALSNARKWLKKENIQEFDYSG